MLINEPSLKIAHAFLSPETRKALSLPVQLLIVGALSQVETIVELTNRVFDSGFHRPIKTTRYRAGSSSLTCSAR